MDEEKEFQGGERLYLGKTISDRVSISEHLQRYRFTLNRIKQGDVVLDAACGSGYGSKILSEKAAKVVGLEISDHALNWARKNYQSGNIEFKKADLNEKLDFTDQSFDLIASFETLEHIASQENMLSEFKRVLKENGLLIISSPDREIITEKAGAENKFHINELSKKEFINLLSKYFSLEELYGQTRYIILPLYKRLIKAIVKLDFLKLRRVIVRLLGLKIFVHKHFAPLQQSPIEKVTLESPNDFYVLIAVCRKVL